MIDEVKEHDLKCEREKKMILTIELTIYVAGVGTRLAESGHWLLITVGRYV